MEKGWNAAGLLRPLWERLPGKRDELAEMTGISPGTLSGYNTGRLPLGIANARKIADALNVSLLELGGSAEDPSQRGVPDRLQSLEAEMVEVRRILELVAIALGVEAVPRDESGSGPTHLRRLSGRMSKLVEEGR